ncbi:MAG: 50S ribosomal protein L22 [Kiritimatiellaeota bacterium]|nr:50S ribosomal protein L22 [Kiritimatiellota bacterium]
MEVKAISKNMRISPDKGRDLARAVQGKGVGVALKVVEFSPRKAATMLRATLKSAMANAQHNCHLDVDKLSVKKCVFDEGPRMRRFWPVARGSAHPIEKQFSHITVVLTDDPVKAAK